MSKSPTFEGRTGVGAEGGSCENQADGNHRGHKASEDEDDDKEAQTQVLLGEVMVLRSRSVSGATLPDLEGHYGEIVVEIRTGPAFCSRFDGVNAFL